MSTKPLKTDNKYYVYLHTFSDGSLYIGKGTGNRAQQKNKGRPIGYIQLMRAIGEPVVSIIKENLSEMEAYNLEHDLIKQHRRNNSKILNRTDGLEQSPIGTMPPQTLLFSDRSKAHPKYKQIVHLKNIERDGSYSIAISIMDAAIKTKTPCDELISKLNENPELIIGGYQFISQDEAINVAPWYKSEIIALTNRALSELNISPTDEQ